MSIADPQPTGLTTRPESAVSIVGGGASGVLAAVNLLRSSTDPGLRVTLYEASGTPARGAAYRTTDPRHLLNVRARDMSALPDEPGHFVEWARRTGLGIEPTTFAPRMVWGRYLSTLLRDLGDERLTVLPARVDDVRRDGARFEVCAGGVRRVADAVVLATGNAAPRPLRVDTGPLPAAPWHVGDPWADRLQDLPPDATVVLVGSGLTAVDVAITLLSDAPGRRVLMVSRSGELPRAHATETFTGWVTPIPEGELTADGLAGLVTDQIAAAAQHGVDWRAVVDGLRAPTQSIWQRLSLLERRRFLVRHVRRWEIHRHRMAPEVASRIEEFVATERLQVARGGLVSVQGRGERCRVGLAGQEIEVDAVVNCTGPLTDLGQSTDPLLRRLAERGTVVGDPLGLGIDCTLDGQVLNAAGDLEPGLFLLGPPRKGLLFESTAVPEIRQQAALLAHRLISEHAR